MARKLRFMFRGCVLLAASVLVCTTALAAPYVDTLPDGTINVGAAFKYTVFTLGGDVNVDNTVSLGDIYGNVGVGGNGSMTMTNGTVHGNVYHHSGGNVKVQGPAKVTGSITTDDASLDQASADAISLSAQLAAEPVTPAYAGITSVTSGSNYTITGGPNQKVVLSLQNFTIQGSDTFTLQGTATTSFIINISGQFSMGRSAAINLVNVPTKNVVFNITGTGANVGMTGGTTFRGVFLAPKRKASFSLGTVYGKIIANAVTLSSGGQIVSQ